MLASTAVAATDASAGVNELQDAIAHLVASALEAGGVTWHAAAPIVHDLLDGAWAGAEPVVVARALARAQRRQAAAVEHALAHGDPGAVHAVADDLERARTRLMAVLAAPERGAMAGHGVAAPTP